MTGMEKHSEEARYSAVDVLQAVLRFSRAVRTRKIYVGLALALAAIFGGIYFATATRIYEATASLMVTPRSADLLNANSNNTVRNDTLIPTYESLFGRAVVLDGAIDRLLLLSPKYRIDFEDVDRDKWRRVLEDNLSAQALRRTNIIELTYRSKSAEAASAVVEAIVSSYLEFVEEDHKDMSTQLVEILRVELAKNESELISKKRQL
ncbi:MAG TPA: hypothetical protein EYQ75_08125, partial [Planctomycetaceae bacterium]|nr:hypothetical protein [Planctomycetaceae bacterium]